MNSTSSLSPAGKPARALRALAEARDPISEAEMWQACKNTHGTHVAWYGELRTLLGRGFVDRSGELNRYRWVITDAGRDALAALAAKAE